MTPFEFFFEHAGFSYDPKTEKPEQGREKCARNLAEAEAWALEQGFQFKWEVDLECDSTEFDKGPAYNSWCCSCYDSDGKYVDGVCGVDFGRDNEPWGDPYKRLVEAELALEQFTEDQDEDL